MSAFLGKIHYLLYDKILLQEKLLNQLITLSHENNIDLRRDILEAEDHFGTAIEGNLEEIIDHNNIHGYLQERIHSVESRQGFITLKAIEKGLDLNLLIQLYHQSGLTYGQKVYHPDHSPYQLFMGIYSHLLDGMPCDRVNAVTENTETHIQWETTTCLHKGYWHPEVEIYYTLTDAFIEGFVFGASSKHMYSRDGFTKTIVVKE
ncbi:MAG: hypothetical protein JXR88_00715 [Clostridia bacterium]|nr:hypothetical protein [Clostridia bacterium]